MAIGAAIQAGLYDGLVSGVMVMDIWQATLMRAFATKQLDSSAMEPEECIDEPFNEDAGGCLTDDCAPLFSSCLCALEWQPAWRRASVSEV